MKRFTAVVTAAASASLVTAAIGMVPAFAATNPATPVQAPARVVSQFGSGQYVSVVSCSGQETPPSVRVGQPNVPLHVTGGTPSYAVTKAMAAPGRYKTVYTCAVVIEKKVTVAGKGGGLKRCELASGSGAGKGGMSGCRKPVTLNTGFGGASGAVSAHHPRTR